MSIFLDGGTKSAAEEVAFNYLQAAITANLLRAGLLCGRCYFEKLQSLVSLA
jgi:hypothetical protein